MTFWLFTIGLSSVIAGFFILVLRSGRALLRAVRDMHKYKKGGAALPAVQAFNGNTYLSAEMDDTRSKGSKVILAMSMIRVERRACRLRALGFFQNELCLRAVVLVCPFSNMKNNCE